MSGILQNLNAPQPALPASFSSGESKSPSAFRTISEVATDLSVPQHVLRFWESKFQQIRPLKRGGGRRYYRPEDIQVISNIKDLLYNQGFTIRGVQKLLKETSRSSSAASARSQQPAEQQALNVSVPQPHASNLTPEKRREIEGVLQELKSLRDLLRQGGI